MLLLLLLLRPPLPQVCSAAGVRFTSAEVVDIRVVEDGRATQLVTRDGEVYKSRWAPHGDGWRRDAGLGEGSRAHCGVRWEATYLLQLAAALMRSSTLVCIGTWRLAASAGMGTKAAGTPSSLVYQA